jgi:hypothetical protein
MQRQQGNKTKHKIRYGRFNHFSTVDAAKRITLTLMMSSNTSTVDNNSWNHFGRCPLGQSQNNSINRMISISK